MRKIREVLRLKFEHDYRDQQIAQSCAIGRSTVGEYLQRFEQSDLSWPLPETLDDGQLEATLFPASAGQVRQRHPEPDWETIHQQLRRKGVTRQLLWQEYKACHPEGLQYSQFCEHYKAWHRELDVVMRQHHRAGEKLFVDYAGQTMAVIDRSNGELHQAQIFVAVLGASNYTYAEATWSQSLSDWLMSHVRTFAFLGGCPEIVVPDNLKSAVNKPCRYEPELNPSYQELAAHYQIAVIPARVAKPRDKAKVELGVQIVERWLLARLRDQRFFSLSELNQALAVQLEALNAQAFQKLPGSRRTLFEQLERPVLKALPAQPYQFGEWRKVRVSPDYHVEAQQCYYSVPYTLSRKQLDLRLSAQTVELFYRGQRVASHVRSVQPGKFVTVTAHMAPQHRHYAEWTPQRLLDWAQQIGPQTAALVAAMLTSRAHVQQGFRAAMGLRRLGKSYGPARLEAAAARALAIDAPSYKSLESILKHGLDQQALTPEGEAESMTVSTHTNLRGARYYH
ncbi:MAG: IS21 family transposase [Gammaproteobacteria bacterium]